MSSRPHCDECGELYSYCTCETEAERLDSWLSNKDELDKDPIYKYSFWEKMCGSFHYERMLRMRDEIESNVRITREQFR